MFRWLATKNPVIGWSVQVIGSSEPVIGWKVQVIWQPRAQWLAKVFRWLAAQNPVIGQSVQMIGSPEPVIGWNVHVIGSPESCDWPKCSGDWQPRTSDWLKCSHDWQPRTLWLAEVFRWLAAQNQWLLEMFMWLAAQNPVIGWNVHVIGSPEPSDWLKCSGHWQPRTQNPVQWLPVTHNPCEMSGSFSQEDFAVSCWVSGCACRLQMAGQESLWCCCHLPTWPARCTWATPWPTPSRMLSFDGTGSLVHFVTCAQLIHLSYDACYTNKCSTMMYLAKRMRKKREKKYTLATPLCTSYVCQLKPPGYHRLSKIRKPLHPPPSPWSPQTHIIFYCTAVERLFYF